MHDANRFGANAAIAAAAAFLCQSRRESSLVLSPRTLFHLLYIPGEKEEEEESEEEEAVVRRRAA